MKRGPACVVATLSCLGLGPDTAALRAQASDGRAGDRSIAPDEIRSLLAELDAAFGRGDLAGYASHFVPDHAGAFEMRRRQLERWLSREHPIRRTSTIDGQPQRVGDRTVLRIRHQLRGEVPAGPDGAMHDLAVREDTMLALQRLADGRLVATFEVEVPADAACLQGDVFRCPPCNYEIGGVEGWLCVPEPRERAQSLEAADFWLIGTDVVCSISVRVDCRAPTATQMAQELAATILELDPRATATPATPWTPASLAGKPPQGLDGVRLELAFAADERGGSRAILHVLVFAGLQHILFVRGSDAALRTHGKSLEHLLGSYRLLDVDAEHARFASKAMLHHTGGTLDGVRYRNDAFGVSFDGPDGWRAEQRCGGAAFHVRWTSPTGSRVYLRGHRAPTGMTAWCPKSADRWVQQLCDAAKLEAASDSDPASAWTEHATCGGRSRTLVCVPRDPGAANAPRRVIRMLLRGDLLLVIDSATHGEADEQVVHRAVETLRAK